MKRALCCAVLLPLIALTGSKSDLSKVQTVWNDGRSAGNTAPVYATPRVAPHGPASVTRHVGRIDTVGGTTYDWQASGPCDQYIYVDTANGVHVVWLFSADSASPWSDRNTRYNFYDFADQQWADIDTANFMNDGFSVFSIRSGLGNLDVDPVSHCEYICGYQAYGFPDPIVARDEVPGAGIFQECSGPPSAYGCVWPSMCLTHSEEIHCALSNNSTAGIFESDVNPWCTWSTPMPLNDTGPNPGSPGYSYTCTGSKTSTKAVISWVYMNPSSEPNTGYYRQTTNDGVTWDTVVPIPLPPAFTPGSESIATFGSICPFLDEDDNLHVVASVGWTVAGMPGMYPTPTEIWHWYQPTGTWSEIVRWGEDTASYETRGYGVGFDALFADRPTLCQSGPNEFVCVWEGFDSLNVEPRTNLLRADIYAARSTDNGASWGWIVPLTDPDSTSKRFPSIASRTWRDTCFIRYEDDLVAGFGIAPYSQGPVTNNPIIVQRVYDRDINPAIAESRTGSPGRLTCAVGPSPFRGGTVISYELPKSGNVVLSVCDVSGRTARVLVNETKSPGRYSTVWDGRDERGTLLPAGVYFTRLEAGAEHLTRKVVIAR